MNKDKSEIFVLENHESEFSYKKNWPTKKPIVSIKDKKLKTFKSFKKIYKGL